MKDGKAVNYNGSEIIGSIHLKNGKRMACRDNFFTVNAGFPPRFGEVWKSQQRGTYPDLFRGSSNLEGRRYTRVILLDFHVPKSADTYICRSEEIRNFLLKQNVPTNIKVSNPLPVHLDVGILDLQYNL